MSEKQPVAEAPKMVTLTINGKTVQAKPGTSVFQAGMDAGIFIPHYCYHVDLSIAGVCRMCMVEVEKAPKPQISCNLPVAEGMVVRTNTDKIKEMVKGVLELHLINHPLDCPICDKAGECKLQDFYRDYGLYESKMDYEKVHKPKVVDIGTIVLDSERCILCTRCVRFTAEVTKTNELGIFNRGDRSELRTYDEGPLRNDYTGNLADICPVGALTAKDFRFRQRVWFLDPEPTVCAQCAHGCNTETSVNPQTKKLFRIEPRRNPDVNKSWICDTGRWDFHYVYNARIKTPRSGDYKGERTWHDFFRETASALSSPDRLMVALSTHLTNEEIADCVLALKEKGVTHFTWIVDEAAARDRKPYDGILKHKDLTPNAMGFERVMKALGVTWHEHKAAALALKGGKIDWLFLLGVEGPFLPGVKPLLEAAPASTKIVVHATNESEEWARAAWVLPNASAFEKSGTLVNYQGRVQKLSAALPPEHTSRDLHGVVWGLLRGNDREAVPAERAKEIFETVVVGKLNFGPKSVWRKFPKMGIVHGEPPHRTAADEAAQP